MGFGILNTPDLQNERAQHQKETLGQGITLYDEGPSIIESAETGVPPDDPSTFKSSPTTITTNPFANPELPTDPDADDLLKKAGFDIYGQPIKE